jgi:hypothetical protein
MYLHKIGTKLNFGDVLSKHTGYNDAWPILRPLLFWKGEINGGTKYIELQTNDGECDAKNDKMD